MRILHAPTDIAGQPSLYVFGLRELNYEADGLFRAHPFDYGRPPDIPVRGRHRWQRRLFMLQKTLRFVGAYDVFHFHYGKSLLRNHLDVRLFRRAGARVVVEFWGSDIRLPSVERSRNPFYHNPGNDDEEEKKERMRRWSKLTSGHVIAADHSFLAWLRPYFEHVHIVRVCVDTKSLIPRYPDPEARVPVIVHAPSRPEVKGTAHVRNAIDSLRARGRALDYVEVTGLSHAEAIAAVSRADLVIDQLMLGAHGTFAVEAMSLGKPVVTYILPELVPTFPEGFPIINANPDTLVEVLEDWMTRPKDRHQLGIRSRRYAEQVHDCRVAAMKLVEAYRSLPSGV